MRTAWACGVSLPCNGSADDSMRSGRNACRRRRRAAGSRIGFSATVQREASGLAHLPYAQVDLPYQVLVVFVRATAAEEAAQVEAWSVKIRAKLPPA
ncbi:MAG: hypothetical protein QM581_08740 [Pseudomonas sp.]